MDSLLDLSPEKFYKEAEKMLEEKDFIEFLSNIGITVALSRNNKENLAKALYLRVQGLMAFNQHRKALEGIEEALKYNTGEKAFTLKKYMGIAKGYLGEVDQAYSIFKELTHESNDINLLAGAYINITWVNLSLRRDKNEQVVEEAKYYLDLANEHFDSLSSKRKWRVLNNYSVYYFYKFEYDKAIEMLEDSIQYCEEEDLADVYNNLAELYLKIAERDGSPVSEVAKDYLEKAEIYGTRHKNSLALGYVFYTKAMIELREEQLFKAMDSLYLSFEYFKDAEATVQACDTLLKINELMDEYKYKSLKSLRENLRKKLKDTPYYEKIKKDEEVV